MGGTGESERERQGYWALFRSEPNFLSFAVALTFFSGFGQSYFLGVFKAPWQEAFGLSHSGYGLCYAIATGTAGFVLVWVGRRIDDVDLRLWTGLVVAALALSCAFVSVIGSVVVLTLALFAMRFSGQGLMTHTAFTSMGRYFEARRGKAMSLTGLGFAIGFGLFPKMGVLLRDHLTWREAWLVAACIVAVLVLPLSLWLLRGHADRHARYLARQAAREPDLDASSPAPQRQWTRAEVLGDVRFWVILPLTLACPFLMTGFIVLQEHVATVKGWSLDHHANALLVLGGAQYVTAISIGPVVDRVGALRLVPWTQVPLAFGLVVLALFDQPASAVVYLGLAGVTMGSMAPIVGSVYPELYGVVHLGSIRALTSSFMVVSTALAPLAMGWMIDRGASIGSIAWIGVGYIAVAMVPVSVVLRRRA